MGFMELLNGFDKGFCPSLKNTIFLFVAPGSGCYLPRFSRIFSDALKTREWIREKTNISAKNVSLLPVKNAIFPAERPGR